MKYTKLFLVALFISAALLISALIAEAQIIAIKAGKLVNPTTAMSKTNQTILVENGIIKTVGADLQILREGRDY